ncbi:beta-1,3-galactosyltransferase brn-like [Oppia nitens]|uniref:beta-1,3-galactosyltransferase brn-like n=1 Tax=Oppia nitens TaxID=1686743 RepID=UPI0023DB5C1B|nr:beta-1,3-galactosyltransferase brn-like [Oppia nitens]
MRSPVTKRFYRRHRLIVFLMASLCLVLVNISGVYIHPFELDFGTNFSYPLDLENFRDIIEGLKEMNFNTDSDVKDRQTLQQTLPLPQHINDYNYRFIIRNENKCSKRWSSSTSSKSVIITSFSNTDDEIITRNLDDITLLIVVKSSLTHFKARDVIRKSWGFEKRFSDVTIKTVFILGNCVDRRDVYNCQDSIDEEMDANKDIVQADFVDSYYNNTIKTMMAFKWSVHYCSSAQFILFVDDDYYVSVKNLLKYIRNPLNTWPTIDTNSINIVPNTPFDGRLYTGYVFTTSSPMRHKTSKWFVSLEDYPYSRYPPYVTAGAYVLSNASLIEMYYASLYTKHFPFDDIYVGILAKKLSITAIHNENFHFWPFGYSVDTYNDVIAAHGFSDPNQLIRVWNQQKSLGFA